MLVAALGLSAACGGDGDTSSPAGSTGTITVLAASSLTEVLSELGRLFEQRNPGIGVRFGFGASSTLARQVNAGAPADVLATADGPTMQVAVMGGSVATPAVFARNRLAILVAKGNPKAIRTVADLARPGTIVVLCAAEVPCGRFGQQVLDKAGVKVTPASLEANVRGVVSKVTIGEADAGIVYVTDVRSAGDKGEGVTIPDAQNALAEYPIATVKATRNGALADAFVAYVRSPDGGQILLAAGFEA